MKKGILRTLGVSVLLLLSWQLSWGQIINEDCSAFVSGWTYDAGVDQNSGYWLVDNPEQITTSAYDLSSFSALSMVLNLRSFGGGSVFPVASLEVSTDGGGSFDPVILVPSSGTIPNSYVDYTVDLSAYDGEANVVFRFGQASGTRQLRINNIELTGSSGSTCAITGATISSSLVCNGSDADFSLDFDVTDGSGDYNIVDDATGTTIYGTLASAATTGTGLTISGTIPNSGGGFLGVRIVDANNGACSSGVVTLTLVNCTPACVEPLAQPTGLLLAASSTSQIDGSFTGEASADNYLVVRSLDATLDGTPTDGTTYSVGDALIANGDTVAYYGPATSYADPGLQSGTEYYYFIFSVEADACSGGPDYLVSSPLTGIEYTDPEGVPAAGLDVTCASDNGMILSWTSAPGNIEGYVIVGRQGGQPSSVNSLDPQTLTASSVFDTEIYGATNSSILYRGSGTTVTISGLSAGDSYTFQVYTFAGGNWSDGGNSGPTTTEIASLTEVSNYEGTASNGGADINWINPNGLCFDEVLIIASEGVATSAVPTGDGSAYTANSTFALGTDLGSNNYAVYQGIGTSVSVSGLTNGTTYFFRIFTRSGTEWSEGLEISIVPAEITLFEPGDFMIIAVNTNGSPEDEVCFISFKPITGGTSFEITDNGYEREIAGLWGNTEGTIRFERDALASTVSPGTPICIQGDGNAASSFDVTLDGVADDANWNISSINGIGTFNINSTNDQIWFLQGGTWTNPFSGDHDSDYDGNVLYGWTADGFEASPNYASTSGTTLYPGLDCFVTDLDGISNQYKVKFDSVAANFAAGTQREWLSRANNPDNWLGYTDNASYNASNPPYSTASIDFEIDPDLYNEGEWVGDVSNNWFDCSNWGNLAVPDTLTNVTILSSATNDARVADTADFASRFGFVGKTANLSIESGATLLVESDGDSILIDGDLTIADGGMLDLEDVLQGGSLFLRGNWRNQSAAANDGFVQGSASTVYFGGDVQQLLQDDNAEETFANVVLSNSSGLLIQSPVDIQINLEFVEGILTTATGGADGANLLDATLACLGFEDGATYTGASDASHVDGVVEFNGTETDSYIFPVGDGSTLHLATLGISSVSGTDAFRAEYFPDNPEAQFGTGTEANVGFVSFIEYWQISQLTGSANRPVTLQYRNPASNIADPSVAYVVRWNGTTWEQAGGNGNAAFSVPNTSITSDNVNGFSPFTFADNGTSFPVEWLSFEATSLVQTVQLDWTTGQEINHDFFAVERRSMVGEFEEIGQVYIGVANSVGKQYSFTDELPLDGVSYYRLRQIDLDGTASYSDVVAVNRGVDGQASILNFFPNPVTESMTLQLNLPSEGPVIIRAIDASGRELLQTRVEGMRGLNTIKVPVETLSAGVYYLQMQWAGKRMGVSFRKN